MSFVCPGIVQSPHALQLTGADQARADVLGGLGWHRCNHQCWSHEFHWSAFHRSVYMVACYNQGQTTLLPILYQGIETSFNDQHFLHRLLCLMLDPLYSSLWIIHLSMELADLFAWFHNFGAIDGCVGFVLNWNCLIWENPPQRSVLQWDIDLCLSSARSFSFVDELGITLFRMYKKINNATIPAE